MLKIILSRPMGADGSKSVEWVDAPAWEVGFNGNLLCHENDKTNEKPNTLVAEFASGEWTAVKQSQ